MLLLIQYTLIFASVLILVALGGCFSEHSGVINIGLEGIMVMGALGGALMMKYLPDSAPAPVVILLVVLASVLVGMIFSLLLGVAAIHFNADQTLVGTALNLLGPAAAVVIVRAINMAENPDNVSSTVAYKVAKKAFLIRIGKFEFSWFMLFALLILLASYVVLYKTRFGLRLMASIPFAGRYRIIDFLLSSLANCGISNISIVVRENYHSLMDHLGSGRAWIGCIVLPEVFNRPNI